jgi:hypothetical protein
MIDALLAPLFFCPLLFGWDRVCINQSARATDKQPWGGWPLINNKQKFVRWLQSHFCCSARFDRAFMALPNMNQDKLALSVSLLLTLQI